MFRNGKAAVLVSLALAAVALAGCITDDSTTTEGDTTPAAVDGNQTMPAENAAPTATATFDVVDDENHTYEFDGSASSDPDGDNLTFAWDFGDGATADGPAVEHTFNASGASGNVSFDVILTVTDPGGLSDTASLNVTFAAGPAPGTLYVTQEEVFEDLLLVGTVAGDGEGGVIGNGVDYTTFTLSVAGAAEDGTAVEAQYALLDLTSSGGDVYNDLDLYFYDPDGNALGSSTSPTGMEQIEVDDPMPAGDYTIAVYHWSGAAADITVDATVQYFTV